MRISIELPEDIVARVLNHALDHGIISIDQQIEDLLRAVLPDEDDDDDDDDDDDEEEDEDTEEDEPTPPDAVVVRGLVNYEPTQSEADRAPTLSASELTPDTQATGAISHEQTIY